MPIWITLKAVLDEFISSALEIAQSLGTVLDKNRGNPNSSDQKFCIAVQTGQPFILTIGAENPVTGEVTDIQVDYNNLPIRCRFCLSTSHLIRDCSTINGTKKPAPPATDHDGKDKEGGVFAWVTPKHPANLRQKVLSRGIIKETPRQYLREKRTPSVVGNSQSTRQEKSRESAGGSETPNQDELEGQHETNVSAGRQTGPSKDQGRGTLDKPSASLDWSKWSRRERERGYASPPLGTEFRDPAEFEKARAD